VTSWNVGRTFFTVGVLQTEAGLVALRDLAAVETEEVVVGEHLHAVVVPGGDRRSESKS